MIDKKIDKKEALELKKIYNHYLDKRKQFMDSTKFKVEDIFGDVISKDYNININIEFNFFKPKKNKNIDYCPNAPLFYSDF